MPSWPNSDSEVAVVRWNQQHYALLSWGRLQHADRVRKTVENEWWGAAFSGRKWRIWIDFFKSSKSFRSMKSSRLALCPRISRTRVWLLAPNFQPMTCLHAQWQWQWQWSRSMHSQTATWNHAPLVYRMQLSLACSLHFLRIFNVGRLPGESEKCGMLASEKQSIAMACSGVSEY